MFANSYISILTVAFGLSIATGASALEVANGLSVNGLSVNGLSVNGLSVNGLSVNGLSVNGLSVDGTEKSADLRLKAIILQDEQILLIE
jgi:GLTT repeat (6 copies)